MDKVFIRGIRVGTTIGVYDHERTITQDLIIDLELLRLLQIRAEYNIEADFLSDVHVLNRYVDLRMRELQRNGAGTA